MIEVHSRPCGGRHEETIWGEIRVKSDRVKVTDYVRIATQRIIGCPFNGNGLNIQCAHASVISKTGNYKDIILAALVESNLPEEKQEYIRGRLENIFCLIKKLDQLARFSVAGGPVMEETYKIFWEVLDSDLYGLVGRLEEIIETNGLDCFTLKTMNGRNPLNLHERQKFQALYTDAQKLIEFEYQKLFSQFGLTLKKVG